MKLQNFEVLELSLEESIAIGGGEPNWVMMALFGPLYHIPYLIGKYA